MEERQDLISRQAAIDELNDGAELLRRVLDDADIVGAERAKYEWGLGLIESYISDMEELPSAQPEPKWIPCSERLPEEEKDVLVARHFMSDKQLKKNAITESFYVEVASYMDDEWTSYSDEYKIKRHLHKVIAWMPLPKPWRGEENERTD